MCLISSSYPVDVNLFKKCMVKGKKKQVFQQALYGMEWNGE
jgi:hypothetical protein